MVELVLPIVDEPALLITFSGKKILCITDLHLGYEFLLAQKGVVIPAQAEEMRVRILDLIERTNADYLIIIGDVKHNIFRISFSEWRGVARLLENISKQIDVQITLGNHDVNLDLLLSKDIIVHSSKGVLIEDEDTKFGFIHGHAWPNSDLFQADYIIIGHNHPVIEMRDELGGEVVRARMVRT
ncbi:MAG: metallophosphoesterase [Candidatus Lokiarchaeia archaeon]